MLVLYVIYSRKCSRHLHHDYQRLIYGFICEIFGNFSSVLYIIATNEKSNLDIVYV